MSTQPGIGAVAGLSGLTLAAGEFLARRIAHRLPTQGEWFDEIVDYKARQLRHLARRRSLPEVVVAGHSMTFDACEPTEMSRRLGVPVYNAGINLAPLTVLQDWVRYVTEIARPRTLVVGLTTLDLNESGLEQTELLQRHRSAPAGTASGPRRGGTAPVFLPEVVSGALTALRRASSGAPLGLTKGQYLVGPQGKDLHKNAARYRVSPGFEDRFRSKWLNDFRVGQGHIDVAAAMLAHAQEAGGRVVLFIPPFTPDFVRLHPRGQEDVSHSIDALYGVAAAVGCDVAEAPRRLFSIRHFADPVHLNDLGMSLCTGWLSDYLLSRPRT